MAIPITQAIEKIVFPMLEEQIKNKRDIAVPYLVGPPGIGKTQMFEQECLKRGWGLLNVCFPTIPLEELTGMPRGKEVKIKINGDEKQTFITEWSLPELVSILYELAQYYPVVVFFLDDNHLCDEYHQSMLFSLLTDGKLKMNKLPSNCVLAAAGNRTVRAGARNLFSAVVARIASIDVTVDVEHWLKVYAKEKGLNPLVTAFIQQNPHMLLGEESNEPWPCPREWTYLANALSRIIGDVKTVDEDFLNELVKAHVGKQAAAEFIQFVKIIKEIDAESIINGKVKPEIKNLKDAWVIGIACTLWILSRPRLDKKLLEKYIRNAYIPIYQATQEVAIMLLSFVKMRSSKALTDIVTVMENIDRDMVTNFCSLILEASTS